MHYLCVKMGQILINNRNERYISLIKKFQCFAVTMAAGFHCKLVWSGLDSARDRLIHSNEIWSN